MSRAGTGIKHARLRRLEGGAIAVGAAVYRGHKRLHRLAAVSAACLILASCSAIGSKSTDTAHINTKTKFSSAAYGAKPSPRVATSKTVRKGGGRYLVGKPYKIAGKWYAPQEDPDYVAVGKASWYGPNFHGRLTANGEVFDQYHLSAAHPTLPLPSYVRVTNTENGNSIVVRVNDRGPFHGGRIIDVSSRAADLLDIKRKGTAKVRVEYVGRAQMDGRDMPQLMASYRPGEGTGPAIGPDAPAASTTMLAMNENHDAVRTALVAEDGVRPTLASFDGALLPAIGPKIEERPNVTPPTVQDPSDKASRLVSAYAEARVIAASAPFDAVLDSASLQPAAIARSGRQRR